MKEKWEYLEEFPEYCISNYGEIYQAKNMAFKRTYMTRQGVVAATLYRDGRQFARSVALLVAKTFVTPLQPIFQTPIHLDGDKTNCRADNLVWRSRPFAIAYHRQFSLDTFSSSWPIKEVETDEVFEYPSVAATRYGLIRAHLIISAHERMPVWPTGQLFETLY